jgi:hypothetical protein
MLVVCGDSRVGMMKATRSWIVEMIVCFDLMYEREMQPPPIRCIAGLSMVEKTSQIIVFDAK